MASVWPLYACAVRLYLFDRAECPTWEDRIKASGGGGKRVPCPRLVIFRLVCLARAAPFALPLRQPFTLASFDEPGGRCYLLIHSSIREYFASDQIICRK